MSAQPGAHGDLWRKSQYSENSQTRISCPKSQGCDSAETQLYNWICQKPVTLNAQLPRRRCCFRPSPTRLLRLPEPWLFWPLFVCLFTCFFGFPPWFLSCDSKQGPAEWWRWWEKQGAASPSHRVRDTRHSASRFLGPLCVLCEKATLARLTGGTARVTRVLQCSSWAAGQVWFVLSVPEAWDAQFWRGKKHITHVPVSFSKSFTPAEALQNLGLCGGILQPLGQVGLCLPPTPCSGVFRTRVIKTFIRCLIKGHKAYYLSFFCFNFCSFRLSLGDEGCSDTY